MDNYELRHHGIKDMKWGIRRYQNKDGTLTEAGKKRYARDQRENAAKKKENRIDLTSPDPDRWVKEDLERTKQTTDAFTSLNKEFQKMEQVSAPKQSTKKMDLSNMTDKEMRDRINRELLERQYNTLFAEVKPANVSKGRQVCRDILETTGTALTLASSALGIALAVKQLKG